MTTFGNDMIPLTNSQPLSDAPASVPAVQNWKLKNANQPRLSISEYPLYTDSHIMGGIRREDWPYAFLNTIPLRNESGLVQHTITLRVDEYREQATPDFSKTDNSLYHGGLIEDEIAALASLCLGSRIKAGGMNRVFDALTDDPLGRPIQWNHKPLPSLTLDKHRLILPDVVGTHSLDELTRLESLPTLNAPQSIALVRAARFYQDALWVAESEPALAWLMLVSALETAANQWRGENGTAPERLAELKPDLVAGLVASGGDTLVQFVAEQIENTLGATRKFLDFTLTFLPFPPQLRPNECDRISWESAPMKKVLNVVYNYRSAALHGGTPFPAPMCEPPQSYDDSVGYSELGTTALAASSYGGVWKAKDLPINLHAFHYIVRGTLLGWWETIAGQPQA